MRTFKLSYVDRTFSVRGEKQTTERAMPMDQAQALAAALTLMDCSEFEFIPVRQNNT